MDFDPLPQQRLAIEAPLGPVLVVAGPGAGKTFCLIARINHLINTRGLAPERICAVTFTNRAAEEIAVRLKHTLGDRAEGVTRGTIHALCLALLREHAEAAGLRKGFGVADEQYQKVILGRLHVPLEQRGSLLNRFSRHRVQDYRLTDDDARLYREYAVWLAHRNMLDFDDLVVKAEELVRTHGDIADAIAARWDYLLVDEFQDVNAVQYDLLKRLAAPHGNFFAVGDDEQSIFTWTGADPYVLVRFSRDYEIDRPIVLDKNCRCSRQIFETARRVLAQNPQLFEKQLSAEQESAYEVGAFAFRDEEEEAAWLLEDILADRAASGLGWGDYAILYRRHKVGEYLEGRLVRAGIPCRLARGRSLVEDDVIKYVIAALGIVRDPGDPVALEAFARCVLSPHFLQEVLASPPFPLSANAERGDVGDFLSAVRTLARRRPAQDPDTKKLWRLVFQVENLRALTRSHRALVPLVDEILSQSVGPYRNALEERHDELTDPATIPEAVRLAGRLAAAIAAEQEIVIAPQGGLEIALRGMLIAAGVRHLPTSTNLHQPPPTSIPSALILFKALQLLHARELDTALERYVTFDLETTDKDVEVCEVVEVGAVRVVGGEIVDRFHSLVRPYRPITPGATKVHGYTDGDVRNARPFAEVWPEFRAFIGDDVLIAHNGQHFDIPVLRRLAAGREGVDTLVFYDTLPLVRSLSRDSAKLEDLALRFGIDAGRAHHALDDAVTLARVYRELERLRAVRARKAVLVNLLDYLGLALALEPEREQGAGSGEREILFKVAKFYTLGRYSDALAFYEMERERSGGDSGPSVDEVIRRLGGRALMTRLRAEPDPAQRYPAAVARLRALIDEPSPAEPASPPDPLSTTWASPPDPLSTTWRGGTLKERIDRLLDRVALSTSEGIEVAPDRVNLLTLHSTKGLEFSRVYIVGVEDYQIPGLREAKENRQAEIQEARRLLYVGMTRTRERLVLTRVERRFGMEAGGSSFLEEMGLEAQGVGAG